MWKENLHNVHHEPVILEFIAGFTMFIIGMYILTNKEFKWNHPYPFIAIASLAEAAFALHFFLLYLFWKYAEKEEYYFYYILYPSLDYITKDNREH